MLHLKYVCRNTPQEELLFSSEAQQSSPWEHPLLSLLLINRLVLPRGTLLRGRDAETPVPKSALLPISDAPLPWGRSLVLIDDVLWTVDGLLSNNPWLRIESPLGIHLERGTSQLSLSNPGIPGMFLEPGIPGIIPPVPSQFIGNPPPGERGPPGELRPFLMTDAALGRNPRFFSASEWISLIILALIWKSQTA